MASKRSPGRTLESRNLTVAIKNIARACGDEISETQPLLDARLEDGSRVAAMFPPCAVTGPVLTIRKFTRRYSLDDLIEVGTLTAGRRGSPHRGHQDAPERAPVRWDGHGKDDTAERPRGPDSQLAIASR